MIVDEAEQEHAATVDQRAVQRVPGPQLVARLGLEPPERTRDLAALPRQPRRRQVTLDRARRRRRALRLHDDPVDLRRRAGRLLAPQRDRQLQQPLRRARSRPAAVPGPAPSNPPSRYARIQRSSVLRATRTHRPSGARCSRSANARTSRPRSRADSDMSVASPTICQRNNPISCALSTHHLLTVVRQPSGQDRGHSGTGQGVHVLTASSPPAVNADTHDHGERRPNRSDATLVHTPIASMRVSDQRPPPGRRIKRARPAPAPTAESDAAISSASDRNRRRQSRTVSPGTPSRSPARRYPSRPAESSAAPITSTTYRRRARHTSGSSTCVARHDRSRQRPRRGRNRRTPEPVRTSRNREQPQPPNTPARQRGQTNRPAARSASTTARSSETMSTTTSNGVTGSLVSPRQGFGEGALNQQDHHHPVAGRPAARQPITTQRVADRPRRHHPACRSTGAHASVLAGMPALG